MADITIVAKPREQRGKNEARRLRAAGMIPAVIYGNKSESIAVSVDPKQILAVFKSEQGENTLFKVKLGEGGEPVQAMLKDFLLEPIKHTLLHVDMVRIASDRALHLDIPVVLEGSPAGVKEGGLLEQALREMKVECLPADIPDRIHVDVSAMNIGSIIRVKDLTPPARVKFLADEDLAVATVQAPRKEEEAPAEGAAPAEGPAEPEVLKKGKTTTEEEEGK